MGKVELILFDFDDTLYDCKIAMEQFFRRFIREKCYGVVDEETCKKMVGYWQELDGDGYRYKPDVFQEFFDEFPPGHRIPYDQSMDYWLNHFYLCCDVKEEVKDLLKQLKKRVRVGMITNGRGEFQRNKLRQVHMEEWFDPLLISWEVGVDKPDPRIFHMALEQAGVAAEHTLFVGDYLKNDIVGCQGAGIRGVWFNPHHKEKDVEVQPWREIDDLTQIVTLLDSVQPA